MFSFFKKKISPPETTNSADTPGATLAPETSVPANQKSWWRGALGLTQEPEPVTAPDVHASADALPPPSDMPPVLPIAPNLATPEVEDASPKIAPTLPATEDSAALAAPSINASETSQTEAKPTLQSSPKTAIPNEVVATQPERKNWLSKLKEGLRKTSSNIASVFVGTKIDDALYEELEDALLMADTGVKATAHLLADLKRRVKEHKATEPSTVKELLIEAITELLSPLEKTLVIGEHTPTVIMVAGVNGAGKTTSIGKLTCHLSQQGASVLLAAADTFRAAAREQLSVWANRNTVEIVSQEGADPAAVCFDAVSAGRARKKDVVLVDTAGRLPTQAHLMEELKKIRRVIQKAEATAPHEILLVIDGNTGQNALAQVRAFDDALQLTGLIVTKLDGTAKGGVLAAIAQERPIPVYFVGVGEKLEDLETFKAREFAQALLA